MSIGKKREAVKATAENESRPSMANKAAEAIASLEKEAARDCPAMRYHTFLKGFGIDFRTEGETPVEKSYFGIAAEDFFPRLQTPDGPARPGAGKKARKTARRNPAVAQKAGGPARKVARNAKCPCGSGRRYKRCCGK